MEDAENEKLMCHPKKTNIFIMCSSSQTDKKSHVMHMHYLVMHTKIMPSVNTDFGNIEVNKIDMVPAITDLLTG